MDTKIFAWQPSPAGDIRASSMDEHYPWTVEPCLVLPPGDVANRETYWRVANLVTGYVSGWTWPTFKRAEQHMLEKIALEESK